MRALRTCAALAAAVLACPFSPPVHAAEKPRGVPLGVLVVFDQLRGDYLTRWDRLFVQDGFRRLTTRGAWMRECHYPYSGTVTGAGHASVATGASPDRHGIVGNNWYDRSTQKKVYCVGTDRYEQVPAVVGPDGKKEPTAAPVLLEAPTLADALKEATQGKGRVVALSMKDRSAVLPGGQQPDACYWLDSDVGGFVTSTFYRDRPHPWVERFNRSGAARRWFGQYWNRLHPAELYDRYAGPDDAEGEGTGVKQGVTFPHPLNGGLTRPGGKYFDAVNNSPFGNELLLELAREAIAAEQLGQDEVPDLLCISFSSNDLVGHTWGPDSHEVLDITLRSDLIVRDLMRALDRHVGEGRYMMVVTADHGVCPLPEVSAKQGWEARRVNTTLLARQAESFLNEEVARSGGEQGKALESVTETSVHLSPAWLKRHGLEKEKVALALARWLEGQPGIQKGYTRGEIEDAARTGDALLERVRKSYHPGRSGDVIVVTRPYYLFGWGATGTTHGSAHPYDTHVPLLVYGPGVRVGVRHDLVTPQASAVILGRGMGIGPPAKAEAEVPAGLFGE